MKIAVYTCALNEEAHADRWAGSTKDADQRLVMDTGSSDQTVQLLGDLGVTVGCMGISPFRFDDAKNTVLHLLDTDVDVAIQLDMDEVLTPDWRTRLEAAWKPGTTRLQYKYVWSWTDESKPDQVFYSDKISGRFTHRWRNPIHEVLQPTVPEVISRCDTVLIEHHPDRQKSRANYLPLLQLSVLEDPLNDRNSHYFGRELYFHQKYEEAINEFRRHLVLPTAKWAAERAASLRYGAKCFESLGDITSTTYWYNLAVLTDPQSREALIDFASFLLRQKEWTGALHYANKAVQISSGQSSYINERYSTQEGPYDIMAVALYYMGNKEGALTNIQKAIELNPTEKRLQDNLIWIGNM